MPDKRIITQEENTMPLVTSKEMLENARKQGYAVGAFNVEKMEVVGSCGRA